MTTFHFLRKLGGTPQCSGTSGCPDILELEGGDFAVIGTNITTEAKSTLPNGTGCSDTEAIVQIPRDILIRAKADIPAS